MDAAAPPAQPNPLREGLVEERIPEPAVMVIFGASGDLARRKLLPALYSLTRDRLLPSRFAVLGFGRHALEEDAFREEMRRGCEEFARRRPLDAAVWGAFARNVFYQQGAYDDPAAFQRLKLRLDEIDHALGLPGNRVFYLSTPPSAFAPVIRSLGQAELAPRPTPGRPFARVIIEKPFGVDLETARALNRQVHEILDEQQIYRIDHYLGKETVQNLLVFRFANGIFEPHLEQPLHRPRPDHRVGDRRRRGARRLLRTGRQPARHGAEPPAPGSEPGGDGTAGRVRGRRRPRREAEGAEGAAPHRRPATSTGRSCARSTRPGFDRGARRAGVSEASRASIRTRRPRRTSG